jgi:hypothetical protein
MSDAFAAIGHNQFAGKIFGRINFFLESTQIRK